MRESRTLSIFIDRDWREVYDAIWRPDYFPKWASGLSKSALVWEREVWKAEGPDGPITIEFTSHNAYGIMDHSVMLADGTVIYVPLRVIRSGAGAEVLLTLLRQPDVSDAQYAADAEWVQRDLLALRALLT
jgi:hypothetical protein